jgi:hypothetical protein
LITSLSVNKRNSKTNLTAIIILILITSITYVAFPSSLARRTAPETWRVTLPGGYLSTRQLFIKMFPDLSASSFHYVNPDLASQPGLSSIALTVNLESLVAKTTDYVFYENLHVEARGVACSIEVYIVDIGMRLAQVVCRELSIDVNLWPPGADGVYGSLKAKLRGEVLFSVPDVPGSPIHGYYYQGSELAIEWTFVEPRYTVTVSPTAISVPQGYKERIEDMVTVTPLDPAITGSVGFRFECKDWGGINGGVDTSSMGSWPLVLPLEVGVAPWVPSDSYTANVVVTDWLGGKEYRSNDFTVTVTDSGYDIKVNNQNPFETNLQSGTGNKFDVSITPISPYSSGMPIYWRGTSGDFNGIGIGLPGGVQPPPTSVEMNINAEPWVTAGDYEFDVCVFDDGLKQEFTCHVTIHVYAP